MKKKNKINDDYFADLKGVEKMSKEEIRKKFKVSTVSQEEYERKFCYGNKGYIKAYTELTFREFAQTGDKKKFFYQLFNIIKWLGVSNVARKTKLSRSSIYDALCREDANPTFDTITKIYSALNISISGKINID